MKTRHQPARMGLVAILFMLAGIARGLAHEPGLSTAQVRLRADQIDVTLCLSGKDARELMNLNQQPAVGAEGMTGKLGEAWEIMIGEQVLAPRGAECHFDPDGNAAVQLTVPGRLAGRLQLRSKWLPQLPPGHRQFLSIQDARGRVLAEHLLSASSDSASIELSSAMIAGAGRARGSSFFEFLALGGKHILIGYDHLLFLFTILIVSRERMAALKIITCFTVAHSITLALAAFTVVQIPGRVVEPLIAASIIFVAVANLRGRETPMGRMVVVFAFGLIHGLGFASVLRELGLGTSPADVILPLLSFNLGVELGQLLIALPLIPLLRRLNEHPVFVKRWVPACSIAAALAGGFWLVQRLCPTA